MAVVDLRHGDCRTVMAAMPAESVDAIVCDPPYGLSFMGKGWDHGVPGVEFWEAALRVLKPGGHLLAFGGTRTFHRLACAVEDAGFEIRDSIAWLYGSGFPKSLDVSKAIDKAAGVEREVVGERADFKAKKAAEARRGEDNARRFNEAHDPGRGGYTDASQVGVLTAPATPEAQKWNGWGTALKPAFEPVVVARKPLVGTVAANVLAHGTGALNIDGCRVLADADEVVEDDGRRVNTTAHEGYHRPNKSMFYVDKAAKRGGPSDKLGRWPANLIHDGSDEVLAGFPETKSGGGNLGNTKDGIGMFGNGKAFDAGTYVANSGSAARFFYCAKASKADRNEGLDGTCTVKYNAPRKDGALCAETVHLLKRATFDIPAVRWLIGESGASITALCPSGSLSTTSTAIKRITTSGTLSWLTPLLTSESIADASCVAENGGSRAKSAESSSQSPPTTTSASPAELALGAASVASAMLWLASDAENWETFRNIHSTVKPTDLMRYLCRLVTPPGGIVLDPFMGSGSTGKAAVLEGFNFTGIELDVEYIEIARARIAHALQSDKQQTLAL